MYINEKSYSLLLPIRSKVQDTALAMSKNSLRNSFNFITCSQLNIPTSCPIYGKTWSEALTEEYDFCCKYMYTEPNINGYSDLNELKLVRHTPGSISREELRDI